jgi:hypothetical protein
MTNIGANIEASPSFGFAGIASLGDEEHCEDLIGGFALHMHAVQSAREWILI